MNFKILTAVLICSIYHDRTMAQTASSDAIYCDLKTNAGCMNGGVCVNVFYSGVSHNRCFCPAGLNRPNCDYPVLMDSKQCSGSCPSGQSCLYSDSGYTYCGFQKSTVPISTANQLDCSQVSQCPSTNPCGSTPCLVIGNLMACLYQMPSTTATTTTKAVNVCANYCKNNQPCLVIAGTPTCFCSTGYVAPTCDAEQTTTTTSKPPISSIAYSNCPIDACHGQPCLLVNGNSLKCFCANGSSRLDCSL